MNGDEPGAQNIYKMVEEVGECDTVNGSVDGNGEEEGVGHIADPMGNVSKTTLYRQENG